MFSIRTDKMKLATAGNLEAVRALGLFDTQGNVGVQLAEQTVSDVAGGDILTFLSGKRSCRLR